MVSECGWRTRPYHLEGKSCGAHGSQSVGGGLAITTWKVSLAGLMGLRVWVEDSPLPPGRYILRGSWGLGVCRTRPYHLEGMYLGAPARSVDGLPSPPGRYVLRGPCSECGGLALTNWKVCIVGLMRSRSVEDSPSPTGRYALRDSWSLGVWRTCPRRLKGMYCGAPVRSVEDLPSPPGRYVLRGPCSDFVGLSSLVGMYCGAPSQRAENSPQPPTIYVAVRDSCGEWDDTPSPSDRYIMWCPCPAV
jgi:hypothetical protein